MIATRRASEISFYEYLGVTPGASPEEIRDAFRAMVKLLHPDQQMDLQLKHIAETQMRRLNRVYAILSDPERRRYYDEAMEDDSRMAIIVRPPAPARSIRRTIGKGAWIAAILLSAGLLIWFAAEDSPASQGRISEHANALSSIAGADDTLQISRLRSDLNTVTIERDAAVTELQQLRDVFRALPGRSASRPAANTRMPFSRAEELPSPSAFRAARSPSDSILRPPNREWAGSWFYSKPAQGHINRTGALYPPEFIELIMWEDGGALRGRYRSRYEIRDRAVSPDVNFTFQGSLSGPGTFNGSQMSCPWTGSNGAKGNLTLKLTSENLLKIDWAANELGTQQALRAGTAILTRRVE